MDQQIQLQQQQQATAGDRIQQLTNRVKDLEAALRDAKTEIRSLRIENRTLAERLANNSPNLYSSAAILEWIQDDMLPGAPSAGIGVGGLAAATAAGGDAHVEATPAPAPSRRSRAGPAASQDTADGPATPSASSKPSSTSRGRASPAPSNRHPSADPTPRPSSSLGRAASGSGHPAATLTTGGTPTAAGASASPGPTPAVKKAILGKGIDLDATSGLPTNLPIDVGNVQLVSLGTVVFDDGFHNERAIFPLGFTSRREYASATVKDAFTTYTCTVTRPALGNARGPEFQVVAGDNPHAPFTGTSSTDVWTKVIKAANQVCGRHASLKISGPELFGLNHPLVVHWIQKLPGARELPRYNMQEIVVVDARGRVGGARERSVGIKKERGEDADRMDVDDPMDES